MRTPFKRTAPNSVDAEVPPEVIVQPRHEPGLDEYRRPGTGTPFLERAGQLSGGAGGVFGERVAGGGVGAGADDSH
jgi:hypothetical protein